MSNVHKKEFSVVFNWFPPYPDYYLIYIIIYIIFIDALLTKAHICFFQHEFSQGQALPTTQIMNYILKSMNKALKFPLSIYFLLKLSVSKILSINSINHEVVFQKRLIHLIFYLCQSILSNNLDWHMSFKLKKIQNNISRYKVKT